VPPKLTATQSPIESPVAELTAHSASRRIACRPSLLVHPAQLPRFMATVRRDIGHAQLSLPPGIGRINSMIVMHAGQHDIGRCDLHTWPGVSRSFSALGSSVLKQTSSSPVGLNVDEGVGAAAAPHQVNRGSSLRVSGSLFLLASSGRVLA
jgi:hypothetical protein